MQFNCSNKSRNCINYLFLCILFVDINMNKQIFGINMPKCAVTKMSELIYWFICFLNIYYEIHKYALLRMGGESATLVSTLELRKQFVMKWECNHRAKLPAINTPDYMLTKQSLQKHGLVSAERKAAIIAAFSFVAIVQAKQKHPQQSVLS